MGHLGIQNKNTMPTYFCLLLLLIARSIYYTFLPAAKRQGHAELWVEKKKRLMDFWSLKLLFIVSFGMFLSYFELS